MIWGYENCECNVALIGLGPYDRIPKNRSYSKLLSPAVQSVHLCYSTQASLTVVGLISISMPQNNNNGPP
jgi:hypothetical protein